VPRLPHNATLAAWGFYGGIVGTLVGAGLMFNSRGCRGGEDQTFCVPGAVVGGASVLLGTVSGVAWFATHQEEALLLTLSDDESARLRVGRASIGGAF
jgi:hypothetical protein